MTSHTDTSLTQRPLLSAETVNGLKDYSPTEPFSATRPDVAAVLQASRLERPAILKLDLPGFQIKAVSDEDKQRLKTLTETVFERLQDTKKRNAKQRKADALEDDLLLHMQKDHLLAYMKKEIEQRTEDEETTEVLNAMSENVLREALALIESLRSTVKLQEEELKDSLALLEAQTQHNKTHVSTSRPTWASLPPHEKEEKAEKSLHQPPRLLWMKEIDPPNFQPDGKVKQKKMDMNVKFSGESTPAYLSFKARFAVVFYGQSPDVVFQGLLDSTTGDPHKRIKNLGGGERGVNLAMERLDRDYGSRDQIITHFTNQVANLPQANTAQTLQKLNNELEEAVVNLENIGYNTHGLVATVTKKIGSSFASFMAREFGDKLPNLTMPELIEAITTELGFHSAQSRSVEFEAHPVSALAATSGRPHNHAGANTTNRYSATNKPCAFCKGHHYTDTCKKNHTPAYKMSVVKKAELCLICLRRNHFAKDCRYYNQDKERRGCQKCKGKHHTLLHEAVEQNIGSLHNTNQSE